MTTKTNNVGSVILQAEEDMVLCNGYTKTALGGTVTLGINSNTSEWVEMTEIEADALIEANTPKDEPIEIVDEATEQDYLNALEELGVNFNE